MLIRQPHVAGTFYPDDPSELRQFCKPWLVSAAPNISARAVILPHAGYIYSGKTACRVLSRIRVPEKNVLIGPDHRGVGSDFSLFAEGQWETPLGTVSIDETLSRSILAGCPTLKADPQAHAFEHSLEVLVPLLQIKNPSAKIVPLIVGTLNLQKAKQVAVEIAGALKRETETVLVVVSNDMSHYENDVSTRKKDQYALHAIGQLDADALVDAVRQHRVTMCGFVPVYMLLVMAHEIGIQRSTLVEYCTSGDATGDRDRVVGYAGYLFE